MTILNSFTAPLKDVISDLIGCHSPLRIAPGTSLVRTAQTANAPSPDNNSTAAYDAKTPAAFIPDGKSLASRLSTTHVALISYHKTSS